MNKNSDNFSTVNTFNRPATQTAGQSIFLRVRSTGEEITRVVVERSGYRVVRYDGHYHIVRGGARVVPYIVGSDFADSDDIRGRT